MDAFERAVVEDVRKHPVAYRALLWTSLALGAVAALATLTGTVTAGVAAPALSAGRAAWGVPLVLFPLGYAVVVHRCLRRARAA